MSEPTFTTNLLPRFREAIENAGISFDDNPEYNENILRYLCNLLRDHVSQAYRAGQAAQRFLDELTQVVAASRDQLEPEIHEALRNVVEYQTTAEYMVVTRNLPGDQQNALSDILYGFFDEALDAGYGRERQTV
ncbi:MAG TPA: hypothetical protein VM573_00775 [Actinomycetota bacterium]|jgi:hypothetical protein|nr:hypothetical protein [Actinomycetota bacterium]